jgi:hypothetical protein
VLLAMADKVASNVLAVIIRQPAFAEFIRQTADLPEEEWRALVEFIGQTSELPIEELQARVSAYGR